MLQWMDLEAMVLSEMSEKGKYSMLSLIHGIWKMKQTSECNQREADFQIKRTN